MMRQKLVIPHTKVVDADKGQLMAVVSTEAVDRDGDIIRVEGWQLGNFLKHPVLLSSHNYASLRSIIGEWESMEIKQRPARLEGVARYYIGDGNEEADWAFKLAQRGRAAFSVGFIPDMDKAVERESGASFFASYEFMGQELLEVSQVSIPSNPEALQQLKGLIEKTGKGDPLFLGLLAETLKDIQSPIPDIDYRDLVNAAFSKAYREVVPW